MYVAKWEDKLTGKIKYVWFSDTAFLKQNREKEKFQKAETLGKQIKTIEQHILRNLDDKDEARRKVATVSWLILRSNMRVGDEKDPDEADTVGAITLGAEHITFEPTTSSTSTSSAKTASDGTKRSRRRPKSSETSKTTWQTQANSTSSKASTPKKSAAS